MTLSRQVIEELAPDQASLTAARKLLKPAKWPVRQQSADGALAWGDCQGSGSTPYRVCIAPGDHGYKCTCPSRKFPCKHALALMWFWVDDASAFAAAEVPQWVLDWVGRRRGPAAARARPAAAAAAEAPAPERKSIADADTAGDGPATSDPEAAARAERARARNRERREQQILAGLDELETWLRDVLATGLAAFASQARARCDVVAKRLVDAKAPGLALRVQELAAGVHRHRGDEQARFAAATLGDLRLIAAAYRRQAQLPAGLAADARAAVGWTVEREALLADADAPRQRGCWEAVAIRDEVQADRLRRTEHWLLRVDGGAPAWAVLLEFAPVSLSARGASWVLGERRWGEVVYYPSAVPMRGLFVAADARGEAAVPGATLDQAAHASLEAALAAVDAVRARLPWVPTVPFAVGGVRVAREVGASPGHGLWLVEQDGRTGVPLQADADLEPLVGLVPITAVVLADADGGHRLSVAETPWGRWGAA